MTTVTSQIPLMSDPATVLTGWSETTLESLGTFYRGHGGTREDEMPHGLPCVRYGDLYTHHDFIIRSFASFIKPESASSYFPLKPGDLVFAASGETFEEIGKAAVYCEQAPAFAGGDTIIFRPSPQLDPCFAGYAVNGLIANRHKARHGQGSSVIHIGTGHLAALPIALPPYRVQQRIAHCLQTIDQAIEKTEALIEKYQQIKAGLMHDLFTRGIGPDGKLRPPREQAPELYQETPIGWIPAQWNQQPLSFGLSSSPKNGYSPREVEEWEGLYALGLGCLTKGGFRPFQLKHAPRRAAASGAILQHGDFLISRSNTSDAVGLCGVYRDIGYPAIYPDLMMRLKLEANLDREFLERYLLSEAVRLRISAIAVGTSGSMVKINAKTLSDLKIAFPTLGEQRLLVEKARPIEKQLVALKEESDKLQAKKAGLMHDLLTGKVPVNPDPPEPANA